MPSWFPEGNNAAVGDTPQRSLQKINDLLSSGGGSGTVHYGTGDPNGTVTGNVGDLYVDNAFPGKIWTKNTGTATNTGWNS